MQNQGTVRLARQKHEVELLERVLCGVGHLRAPGEFQHDIADSRATDAADAIQAADHAKRLLTDPLFVEAFEVLEKNLQNSWSASGVSETETREQIWLSLRLLERIRLHLTSIVETGDMAKKFKEYQL